mmetsp:Transcript_18389/g.27783  ORF Transcript_18389/g.27783 Transcript_18389/m.27783 type:complete len:317 (-) Transcript_18389:122-1072(-)|eukprot:CAMPEP_0178907872 /NCGR_PEP_ID=MMETSP0786-20121207/7610_1 /TAXON_ID=186022 /ORGANISM="Thalassionema frauenfeldii, Strain CCMP 1798" /LENGTH=316 /DNA_ID=CAMNT_0020579715 /DNA_START=165 /DNA_END=1115 /DNA_ORIENTATION=-
MNVTISALSTSKLFEAADFSPVSYESVVNSVAAGYVAGICGVLVGHPMDSLKVFSQTETLKTLPTANKFQGNGTKSMSTVTAPIQRKLNLRTLYAGVGSTLFTVGLVQSVNFGIYDSCRRCLYKLDNVNASERDYLKNDSIFNVTCSALVAGGFISIMTCPLMVIKTKQQVMTWDFYTAVKKTGRFQNFFVGYAPHFLTECVGRGVYFSCYEILKRHFAKVEGQENTTILQKMMAAGISGMVCWAFIFPFDTIRNKLCAKAVYGDAGSPWQMAKFLYQQGNVRSFYRGFQFTVVRAGPVAAAVLPIYDTTREWLNS